MFNVRKHELTFIQQTGELSGVRAALLLPVRGTQANNFRVRQREIGGPTGTFHRVLLC